MVPSLKTVFPTLKKEPFALGLLQTLEQAGIYEPALFGGALRDYHLGVPIHDYDVWADFGTLIKPGHDRSTIAERLAVQLMQRVSDATIKEVEGLDATDTSTFVGTKVILDYQGREVSLFLNNQRNSLAEKATQGDAPINCVAMDAKGTVAAHPDFFDHLTQRLYKPFDTVPFDRAEERYKKFQAKILGLSR